MIIYSKFLTEGTEGEGLDLFYWNLGDLKLMLCPDSLKSLYYGASSQKENNRGPEK